MDRKTAAAILELYNENQRIIKWIEKHCTRQDKSRVRRGPLQKRIAAELGFTLNPANHEKLKKAFNDFGIRHIKVDGIGYYGELKVKETL